MKTFIIITSSLKYNAVIQDEWKMPLSDHSLFHNIILASVRREREIMKNLKNNWCHSQDFNQGHFNCSHQCDSPNQTAGI